ncbi:MAG: hypothetical protein E7290_02005 [Lachnospiraceae bacterium]|nr:hypothetical protein [Lachnospiraceae bacterium]
MNLYNIEIFTQEFAYRSGMQVSEIEYEFDYLALSKKKIKLQGVKAERGDFIRISKGSQRFCGIVDGVSDSDTKRVIEYKPILSLFDVNVYADLEVLKKESTSVEQWIADIITEIYVSSDDKLQNIAGLSVSAESSTIGIKTLGLTESISNLYEIMVNALLYHDIVVDADVDVQRKTISISLCKRAGVRYIEADLPNVIEKEVSIKKNEEALNKLIVVNEENPSERLSYYLAVNGTIGNDIEEAQRITPVVFETKLVTVGDDEVFEDVALLEAVETLTPEKYDNLIEITLLADDELVKPLEWSIGQETVVLHKKKEYQTILTGMEIRKGTVKLVYGAVRRELTKKLKRRKK